MRRTGNTWRSTVSRGYLRDPSASPDPMRSDATSTHDSRHRTYGHATRRTSHLSPPRSSATQQLCPLSTAHHCAPPSAASASPVRSHSRDSPVDLSPRRQQESSAERHKSKRKGVPLLLVPHSPPHTHCARTHAEPSATHDPMRAIPLRDPVAFPALSPPLGAPRSHSARCPTPIGSALRLPCPPSLRLTNSPKALNRQSTSRVCSLAHAMLAI